MNKAWKKKISLIHKKLLLTMHYGRKIYFSSNNDKRRIIICFDGLFPHGGLVDRLKGIISFYEVAKKLDYDFYIHFEHPFKLSSFLKPNNANWKLENRKLQYNPLNTKIFYLMDVFSANPLELIRKSDAKTILIYSNVDFMGTINSQNDVEENHEIWRNNYFELFSDAPLLEKELKKLPQEKRIVFHTRFTSLMGDFKDTTNVVLTEIDKQKLIDKLITRIKETAVLHPNVSIYVLSDSVFFLNYIKENTKYSILDGNPKHLGLKSSISNLESHLKTFSDFYFMTKSDVIYLLKFGQMYDSGFSKYAAILGNTKWISLQD
jgi:hypothetical protein